MGTNTKIEWSEDTWNPIIAYDIETEKRGWFCTHQSEGCRLCYAEQWNIFRGNGLAYIAQNLPRIRFELAPKYRSPLSQRKGRRIFVDSMSDLFHDVIPFEMADAVFAVILLSPQHTYQILTKNPKRMREYMTEEDRLEKIGCAAGDMLDGEWIWKEGKRFRQQIEALISASLGLEPDGERMLQTPLEWPPRHLQLGVSAERQKEADERVPILLATPAAVRFISYEPALGPLDLTAIPNTFGLGEGQRYYHALQGYAWETHGSDYYDICHCEPKIDQVIAGGESSARARPSHPEWYRCLLHDCQAAGTEYFFKQWGEYLPVQTPRLQVKVGSDRLIQLDGTTKCADWGDIAGTTEDLYVLRKLGKKKAGALLDGKLYQEFPQLPSVSTER